MIAKKTLPGFLSRLALVSLYLREFSKDEQENRSIESRCGFFCSSWNWFGLDQLGDNFGFCLCQLRFLVATAPHIAG
jgi:hypothetical protein